jgi:hypothetical protein
MSCSSREACPNTSDPITYYGPEFAAKAVRKWLNRLDVTTLFIEPGSP